MWQTQRDHLYINRYMLKFLVIMKMLWRNLRFGLSITLLNYYTYFKTHHDWGKENIILSISSANFYEYWVFMSNSLNHIPHSATDRWKPRTWHERGSYHWLVGAPHRRKSIQFSGVRNNLYVRKIPYLKILGRRIGYNYLVNIPPNTIWFEKDWTSSSMSASLHLLGFTNLSLRVLSECVHTSGPMRWSCDDRSSSLPVSGVVLNPFNLKCPTT